MANEKKVTFIAAKKPLSTAGTAALDAPVKLLRVAAYARVSTDQDEQLSSYEAQVSYYTQYITEHIGWQLVEVYADEGITGTSTKHRAGFKRMIEDAKAGKIDIILTKSISRFARNTVDTLETVRQLREIGVEVRFEKERINTLDKQSEILLTIMSSLAQEESRSISENVRWGQQRSMQDGNVHMNYANTLGYRKGDDGKPEIVPEEAEIIRRMFDMFLAGSSIAEIAKTLTNEKVPTPKGKTVWSTQTVSRMLSNEKYIGDTLRQKTYTVDYLSKKVRKNNGEYPQYYIENSHPAIISRETFDMVQKEKERRKSRQSDKYHSKGMLSRLIVCESCGAYYGHRTYTYSDGRKDIWYCSHRYSDKKICESPVLYEKDLLPVIEKALNKLCAKRQEILEKAHKKLAALPADEALKEAVAAATAQYEEATSELQDFMRNPFRSGQSIDEYKTKHAELSAVVDERKAKVDKLKYNRKTANARRAELSRFIPDFEEFCNVRTLTEDTPRKLIRHILALKDGRIEILFWDDTKMVMRAKKNQK